MLLSSALFTLHFLHASYLQKWLAAKRLYSVPMPRIAKAHIVPDYRPLVKDVIKLLRSHGAVPMPADVRRRLQKAGMHGMPSE